MKYLSNSKQNSGKSQAKIFTKPLNNLKQRARNVKTFKMSNKLRKKLQDKL